MSKQQLTPEEVVNINLMLANVRVLSELLHTIPSHTQLLKKHFKELFDCTKKYEASLDKLSSYDSEDRKQQEDVYDNLMEVTYMVRNIVLNPKTQTNEDNEQLGQ